MRLRWWRRRSIVCREAVALMTDYLDGRLEPGIVTDSSGILPTARTARSTWRSYGSRSTPSGPVGPDQLSDDALDELVSLYRRWRADPADH